VAIVMFLRIVCLGAIKNPRLQKGCGAGYGNSGES
jgi:hypothetical protein